LKILILSPFSLSQHLHGGSLRTRELAKALAKSAAQVDVLSFINPLREKEKTYFPVERLKVQERRNWFALSDIVARFGCFPRFVPTIRLSRFNQWRHFSLDDEYDVILYEFPWLWKLLPEIKSKLHILDEHNCEFEWFRPQINESWFPKKSKQWIQSIEGKAFREADAVITCTHEDYVTLANEYHMDKKHIIVANGYFNKNRKSPTQEEKLLSRKKLGLKIDTRVVIFAGSCSFQNQQAVMSLHEVIKQSEGLSHCRFLILGSVKRKLPKNLDPRFHVLDCQENADLYWDASDLSVNPMLEGSGSNMKVLDSLSRGVPVLSTPCGVRGYEGRLSGVMVQEIEKFPEVLRNYSTWPKPNHKELSPFSWEQIGTGLFQKFEELVHHV